MGTLHTAPNVRHPDDIYERLIGMHDGLDDHQSAIANAKLILILINHIGDERIIAGAIALAGSTARTDGSAASREASA